MYEGRRGLKHRKLGKSGQCTFCGRHHKRGKRGDSCRGHKERVRAS